jgi:hypothetical protein
MNTRPDLTDRLRGMVRTVERNRSTMLFRNKSNRKDAQIFQASADGSTCRT